MGLFQVSYHVDAENEVQNEISGKFIFLNYVSHVLSLVITWRKVNAL